MRDMSRIPTKPSEVFNGSSEQEKSQRLQGFSLRSTSLTEVGRLRFERRTSRLKAECSTAELATRPLGMPFRHA